MKIIPLTNSDKLALVDDEDYPLLSRITWSLGTDGYARCSKCRMHQLIMGFLDLVDHRNLNRLDNQKHNLRAANFQQNAWNSPPRKNNKSGLKGVCESRGKWVAQIQTARNGISRHYNLGYYSSKEEVARVYDKKAKELFGENLPILNFPEAA